MYELIKVGKETIGNEEVNAVDARELWKFLESKQEFAHWIRKKVISNLFFAQEADWIVFDKSVNNPINKGSQGGRPTKDYILTLDTAKKVAMSEQTSKGNEVREYFIECEKQLKQVIQSQKQRPDWFIEGEAVKDFMALVNTPESIANVEALKHIYLIGGPDIRHIAGELPSSQNIQDKDIMLEPTELGREFGVGAVKMNNLLDDLGFQKKEDKQWVPTQEGAQFCVRHLWSRAGKSGYNYKWNLNKVKELLETEDV